MVNIIEMILNQYQEPSQVQPIDEYPREEIHDIRNLLTKLGVITHLYGNGRGAVLCNNPEQLEQLAEIFRKAAQKNPSGIK
jgi:hypothetical protein